MDHADIARTVAICLCFLGGSAGGAITTFVSIWSAKHPRARFDFAESARRIRAMPIPASQGA
jgi:hypothetical protein